jgi:hypothetical protein
MDQVSKYILVVDRKLEIKKAVSSERMAKYKDEIKNREDLRCFNNNN